VLGLIEYRIIIYILIFSVLIWTTGCSSATIISNWNELPKDKPIRITTKNDLIYSFDHWRIDTDKTVTETMVDSPRVVPFSAIASIATLDNSKTKMLGTTAIIMVCVCGIVYLIYVSLTPTINLKFGK
jgi:hypothetical protein